MVLKQEVMVMEFSNLATKLEELENIEPKVIVKEVIKEIPTEMKGGLDVK